MNVKITGSILDRITSHGRKIMEISHRISTDLKRHRLRGRAISLPEALIGIRSALKTCAACAQQYVAGSNMVECATSRDHRTPCAFSAPLPGIGEVDATRRSAEVVMDVHYGRLHSAADLQLAHVAQRDADDLCCRRRRHFMRVCGNEERRRGEEGSRKQGAPDSWRPTDG